MPTVSFHSTAEELFLGRGGTVSHNISFATYSTRGKQLNIIKIKSYSICYVYSFAC